MTYRSTFSDRSGRAARTQPSQGWVLFDGACGFCSWWVPFWGNTLRRNGYGMAVLQAPWVRERLGLDDAELLHDLRLLLVDGRTIRGANVYRHVMRTIWWARPLYVLATMPGFRMLFDWGYRTFARNRYWVSNTCRLPAGIGLRDVDSTGGV